MRIGGVKGLIGTTCLQHTQGGNGHPLAARNQHRNDILRPHPLGNEVSCNAVADGIHFGIGVFPVLIDNCDSVWRSFGLIAEQGDDGLRIVVIHICLVETIQCCYLKCCCNVDIAKIFLREEALQHSLIALQELADERFAVFIGIVFCFYAEVVVTDVCLQVKRHLTGVVAQVQSRGVNATQLETVEQHSVPGKDGCSL